MELELKMVENKKIRVMWLLNHTTLRNFEMEQFAKLGINEVFTPKIFPYDEGNLSASVDFTTDRNLSIPSEDLAILNSENWYKTPSKQCWDIANKYFNVVFVGFFPEQLESVMKNFHGIIVLRVFGLAKGYSYSKLIKECLGHNNYSRLKSISDRFWFGAAYDHLKECENEFLQERHCYLPVGLNSDISNCNLWTGKIKKIFFVCPRINTSPYFKQIFLTFKENFAQFDYLIGGAQPIKVKDSRVIGYVPCEVHEQNMMQLRAMFYHSTEPNHIHYHPFEAIRAGMPLVFMAGGMLDLLGGKKLPGRCRTISEARETIKRVLNDDWKLIEDIRRTQTCLLEPMKPENCEGAWQEGFSRILESLKQSKKRSITPDRNPHRVAVFIPVGYRGGSLRAAKLLAQAIALGSRQADEPVEVILAHLDEPSLYPDEEFKDLPASIKRRPFRWRVVDSKEAYRAMVYSGIECKMESEYYQIPDDGINQFLDCHLWLFVSDRLEHPLIPIRPYVLIIYDYLQRYTHLLSSDLNNKFIASALDAERVLVTTEFTRKDAIQFAGISERKIVKLPMLAPHYWINSTNIIPADNSSYFLWTTNLSQHKNHITAFKALRIYYEEYNGQVECRISGVNTGNILKSVGEHLQPLRKMVEESQKLSKNIKVLGELPEHAYQSQLASALFLWHPALIDNGTFSVVEAAALGVPALSSDYPAMIEIDKQFDLNLKWMDPYNPENMAKQLKCMEKEAQNRRGLLPTTEKLAEQSLENLAGAYWEALRVCL